MSAVHAPFAHAIAPRPAAGRRWLDGGIVLVAHGVLLALVISESSPPPASPLPPLALDIRLIERSPPRPISLPAPTPPTATPLKTAPAAPRRLTAPSPTPTPTLAAPSSPAPAASAAPSQPTTQTGPTPAITAARFDAAYLQNPKPAYPAMSRRLGEEGRVVLKVKVSSQGLPLHIEVQHASPYARLDAAARAAVEQWRFIPARQGQEAIEAWVLVPLLFSLDN